VSTRKLDARKRRHIRVRKKITGSREKPRLNVFRSSRHIYAQVIDDLSGSTMISASTLDSELKGKLRNGGNTEAAKSVGTLLAKKASDKGISSVVFDRGGYVFHGRVKALADAAREGGLIF
jgi:large subunit ribosomal protein L18